MEIFSRLKDKAEELSKSITDSSAVGVLSDLGKIAFEKTKDSVSDVTGKMGDSFSKMYKDQINAILSKIDFDSALQKLEEFEKENDTDVSSLKDFIKRLKVLRDGKE